MNDSRAISESLRQTAIDVGAASITAQPAMYRVLYFALDELGGGTLWLDYGDKDGDLA